MIDDIRPQINQTPGSRPVRGPEEPTRPSAGPAAERRQDSVEISEAARARLAEAQAAGLSPERLAEIRQRIADGGYDSDAVKHAVARRILASGDLGA